tara:strand:- start:299 stop:484 length:186 start_codon:yes stop_codon:yes gene_type:complete
MLAHTSASNYYYLTFSMAQHHGYTLNDLENMMPFELEIYVSQLIQYIKTQQQEAENRKRNG